MNRRLISRVKPLHLLVILQALLFLFLYLSPNLSFQHVEMRLFNFCSFRDEPVLGPLSPLRYFSNMGCLETDSRSRAFNMAMLGLNTHLRLALFDMGILHPSLSISWLFAIFLSPLMLFFLARLLFLSEWIALAVSALFLVSIGNISSFIMLFHPGKPFTTLAVITCLYLIKLLHDTNERKYFWLLFLMIFLGGQTDETFYILAPVLPFFYPSLVIEFRKHLKLNLIIFLSFLFNLFFLTFIYPKMGYLLIENYGYKYDFWHYAFGTNEKLHHFNVGWIFMNLLRTVEGHLPAWLAELALLQLLFAGGMRLPLIRSLGIFFLFMVLQTIVLTRRGGILYWGQFYWGILGSLFICFYAGWALKAVKLDALWKKTAVVTSVLILFGLFSDYSYRQTLENLKYIDGINVREKETNCYWKFGTDVYGNEAERLRAAWNNRESAESVAMADRLPHEYLWFKNELVIWRWQNFLSKDLSGCDQEAYR